MGITKLFIVASDDLCYLIENELLSGTIFGETAWTKLGHNDG